MPRIFVSRLHIDLLVNLCFQDCQLRVMLQKDLRVNQVFLAYRVKLVTDCQAEGAVTPLH